LDKQKTIKDATLHFAANAASQQAKSTTYLTSNRRHCRRRIESGVRALLRQFEAEHPHYSGCAGIDRCRRQCGRGEAGKF